MIYGQAKPDEKSVHMIVAAVVLCLSALCTEAAAELMNILPLGDSITRGDPNVTPPALIEWVYGRYFKPPVTIVVLWARCHRARRSFPTGTMRGIAVTGSCRSAKDLMKRGCSRYCADDDQN